LSVFNIYPGEKVTLAKLSLL